MRAQQKCVLFKRFVFKFMYYFNWWKIALQFCVGFCHTTMQISNK